MAATWGSLRTKGFRILSRISLSKNELYNTKVFRPCLMKYSAGLKAIPSLMQCRQSLFPSPIMGSAFIKRREKSGSFPASTNTAGLFLRTKEGFLSGGVCNGLRSRAVTTYSKKGKRKTCKAVAKRFVRTGKGKLKRWRCGKHHNQSKKSNRRKRFLRKPTYASKTQLKKLNKMLNGW